MIVAAEEEALTSANAGHVETAGLRRLCGEITDGQDLYVDDYGGMMEKDFGTQRRCSRTKRTKGIYALQNRTHPSSGVARNDLDSVDV